jgi:CRISPR-associated endonuclease Csn1
MIVFGLDGGIASVGWAVLDDSAGKLAAGVRCFDAPETDKERTPTNALRRQARGQRRVVRRRRQRMAAVRQLLHEAGLLADAKRDGLRLMVDPWVARAAGLDRLLTSAEFAAALGHIAKHRGFRSNSKRDRGGNEADETSKMLRAIAVTQERLGQWRSVGEMFARDPVFATRRRNRAGSFDRSVLRDDQAHEVQALFAAQARLGNSAATEALRDAFAATAFSQQPLQGSEALLGDCPFERAEKRTARRAYSFERFRLLSRLNAIRISTPERSAALTPEQIAIVASDFGKTKGISYHAVRGMLKLSDAVRFANVDRPDEGKRDIVARSGSAAEGTYTLRQLLGDGAWRSLLNTQATLDRIAEVITFRDDPADIRAGLEEAGAEPLIVDALMRGVAEGVLAKFAGAAHLSAKAVRAILPGLARGMVYSEACAEAGYNHAEQAEVRLENIRNPTVRRAIGEMVKQVRAMERRFGRPDRIHIEMARDLGKSAEERDEITRGIDKRNRERDKARARFHELLGREPSRDEMLRFELWEEQGTRCLYTDVLIDPRQLAGADNSVQVDHILPWSRFGDDSFANKTLCLTDANQQKRGRTPFEWFSAEKSADEWERFRRRVDDCKAMKGRKKRGFYLRQNAAEVEEAFRSRNLSDTRYAIRLLSAILQRAYGVEGERRILARPGALTAKLRRAWGLDDLKKSPDGQRLEDDRNHAVDAIVVAATSERLLQQLTLVAQEAERRGLKRDFGVDVPEPFARFREVVMAVRNRVFVSRSERRRARGKAHDATVRQVRERDGRTVVFARRSILSLTDKMLDDIKDVERNQAVRAVLKAWLDAGKPKDALPCFPIMPVEAQADFDAAVAGAYPEAWRDMAALVGAERREARRLLRRRFEAEHEREAARPQAGGRAGPPIRTILVRTGIKPAIMLKRGTAGRGRPAAVERGDMVRVDVFRDVDRRGKAGFYLVPIYRHQVADQGRWPVPPDRPVVAGKPEDEWVPLSPAAGFQFSLFQNSLVEIAKADGTVIEGYFKGLDISTAAINIADVHSQHSIHRSIGAKTLARFRKRTVSRLGDVSNVLAEKRTWHGVACT